MKRHRFNDEAFGKTSARDPEGVVMLRVTTLFAGTATAFGVSGIVRTEQLGAPDVTR